MRPDGGKHGLRALESGMAARMFTPAEANATLPLVKRIVADILEHGREIKELGPRLEEDDAAYRRAVELGAILQGLLGELDEIGCSFESPVFDAGLVDFPAVLDDEPVLLCWRDDEETVAYYHTPEEGFPGRRPIPGAAMGAN